MKKIIYLFLLALGVTGCSVESIDSNENLLTADAKATIQEVGKSMNLLESEICAGEASVFVFDFPQNQNGPHNADTNIKIQIETSPGSGVWDSFKDLTYAGAGPEEYTYNDEILNVGTYSFRVKIGSGGFDNMTTVTVVDCTVVDCQSGYMIGNKNFSDIGTSQNWGWAHQFEFAEYGSQIKEIHNKKGSLGGEVTVTWENGTISFTEGPGVSITHLYVSDIEPTTTNAPGQFDKTQSFSDVDGTFWVMLKAEVCN